MFCIRTQLVRLITRQVYNLFSRPVKCRNLFPKSWKLENDFSPQALEVKWHKSIKVTQHLLFPFFQDSSGVKRNTGTWEPGPSFNQGSGIWSVFHSTTLAVKNFANRPSGCPRFINRKQLLLLWTLLSKLVRDVIH